MKCRLGEGYFISGGTLRAANPLGSGQEGERGFFSQPGGSSGGHSRPQCLIRHQLWSVFY